MVLVFCYFLYKLGAVEAISLLFDLLLETKGPRDKNRPTAARKASQSTEQTVKTSKKTECFPTNVLSVADITRHLRPVMSHTSKLCRRSEPSSHGGFVKSPIMQQLSTVIKVVWCLSQCCTRRCSWRWLYFEIVVTLVIIDIFTKNTKIITSPFRVELTLIGLALELKCVWHLCYKLQVVSGPSD